MYMRSFTTNGYWLLALLLAVITPAHSAIKITELMPCNTSTYINDLWEYAGYAELYNDGTKDVDLQGYTFANDKKNGTNKWSWTINTSCVVKAKQYCMIYFDEVTDREYHVGYKLDTDGGILRLMNDTVTVSSLTYVQQYPHLSYGVGKNGVVGYMEPTPMASNRTGYESIKSRCATPEFSVAPGVKSDKVTLKLSTATSGATIYYTTNGDIPVNGESDVYNSSKPIEITTNTVVRAIAFKSGMLKSEMATGSYIYSDANHDRCNGLTANVVSIVTDNKFYYDDMQGIYVDGKNGATMSCVSKPKNYAQDWTRAANMEYIVNGDVVVNQEVETSIKGGCTRTYATKSLGIKANKKSGKKGFKYVFFPEQRPGVEYDALHLRNGGNAFTTTRYRDGYMNSLANALGLDCQAYEPVAAYINGTYMGLMGLRSPSNKAYVETHYGLDETEIDFIEMSQKIEVPAGDTVVFNKMVSSLRDNDPSSADYFENANKYIDIDNYLDYQIFEQFIANADWPGNNQKLWREHNGGKFRWIVYDLDFGFGLYSYSNDLSKMETNMLKYALGDPVANWNKESWMLSPFAELIKNDEFKYRFLIKYMHHLKYSFSEAVIDSVWESISDKLSDELCASLRMNADNSFKTIRDFALGRPEYIYKQLKEYYKAGNKVSLQIVAQDESGKNIDNSTILVNNVPLGVTDYSVDYYASIPLKVDVKAPAGYKFKKWTYSSKVSNPVDQTSAFEGKLAADTKMTAVFTKETDPQPLTLQINEICSSNNSTGGNPDECGHYADWIEIYNYGTEDIDLAGMYITDDKNDVTKYKFPFGTPDTKVEAGKYVIVWADNESWRGALHTNFKINASGSYIGLTYNVQNKMTTLDSISCPRLSANATYGRIGDGDKWSVFSNEKSLKVTFREKNDTLSIVNPQDTIVVNPQDTIVVNPQDTTSMDSIVSSLDLLTSVEETVVIYPNPAYNELFVKLVGNNSMISALSVYNTIGMRMLMIEGIKESEFEIYIESLKPGVYILRIETNGSVIHKMFEKK